MRLAIFVATALLAALAYAAANDTRVCFDIMLTTTSDQVIAHYKQDTLCSLWKLNKRHVFAAQFNEAQTQVVMLVTYPYAGTSTRRVYLLETYDAVTGNLVSSPVEIKQISLPPVASTGRSGEPVIAMCATESDVFVSTAGSGTIEHFDRTTGALKSMVPYDQIAQSDRVWLACTETALYVSVPSANAVWQMSPEDGLLERIVARVQSPTAISTDSGMLRVVSGRSALMLHSYEIITGTHRGIVDVTDQELFNLRGISVLQTSPFMATSMDEDGYLRQLTNVDDTGGVMATSSFFLNHGQILLADGRTIMYGGLPVSAKTGVALSRSSASQMTNAGNSDKTIATLYDPITHEMLLVDSLGTVMLFSSFDMCTISFQRSYPPLFFDEAMILYNDARDPRMPLLYASSDSESLVFRPAINDGQELVYLDICTGENEIIMAGIATNWPVQIACALCTAELTCAINSTGIVSYPLPVSMLNNLPIVRLAWDESHQNVVLFYGPAEIWLLDPFNSSGWQRVREFQLDTVFDINYWHVSEVAANVYAMRLSAGVIEMISGARGNWTSLSSTEFDTAQTIGTELILVPNRATSTYDPKSFCVGFPINATDDIVIPTGMTGKQRQFAMILLIVCIGAGAFFTFMCAMFCCASLCHKSEFKICRFFPCCGKRRRQGHVRLNDTDSNGCWPCRKPVRSGVSPGLYSVSEPSTTATYTSDSVFNENSFTPVPRPASAASAAAAPAPPVDTAQASPFYPEDN